MRIPKQNSFCMAFSKYLTRQAISSPTISRDNELAQAFNMPETYSFRGEDHGFNSTSKQTTLDSDGSNTKEATVSPLCYLLANLTFAPPTHPPAVRVPDYQPAAYRPTH